MEQSALLTYTRSSLWEGKETFPVIGVMGDSASCARGRLAFIVSHFCLKSTVHLTCILTLEGLRVSFVWAFIISGFVDIGHEQEYPS
jgi:hypothetical protein